MSAPTLIREAVVRYRGSRRRVAEAFRSPVDVARFQAPSPEAGLDLAREILAECPDGSRRPSPTLASGLTPDPIGCYLSAEYGLTTSFPPPTGDLGAVVRGARPLRERALEPHEVAALFHACMRDARGAQGLPGPLGNHLHEPLADRLCVLVAELMPLQVIEASPPGAIRRGGRPSAGPTRRRGRRPAIGS